MTTSTHADNRFTRNRGFISPSQQQALSSATVAIAGVGGVGGRIATQLVRLGVGHIKIADPDNFATTNLNRQEGSSSRTIGKSKAKVIEQLCKDISADVEITAFPEGIDSNNVAEFVDGASLVVEATDFTLPQLGVQLARQCRMNSIPMVMGIEIGFGATLAWFHPAGEKYEQYLGLPDSVKLKALESGEVSVDLKRWLPHVPSYGDLDVLKSVAAGDVEAPAIAPAVDICAGLACTLVVGLLTGFDVQPPAPAVFHFDAKERKSRLIRHPVIHHHASLFVALVKNSLRLHDKMTS